MFSTSVTFYFIWLRSKFERPLIPPRLRLYLISTDYVKAYVTQLYR